MLTLKYLGSYKTSLDTEGICYKRTPQIHLFDSKKNETQNVSFDEVYDKFALRSFTNQPTRRKVSADTLSCHYRPSPSRFARLDFIHQNLLAMKRYI
jgi:GTP pyrophosphokinase